MEHPFDREAKFWVLFVVSNVLGIVEIIPCEVFELKETCFEKYLGNWKKESENCYSLFDLRNFEEYLQFDSFFLESYSYFNKKPSKQNKILKKRQKN